MDIFVEKLDLPFLGFALPTPAQTGRPAYKPSLFAKLFINGYSAFTRPSDRPCTPILETPGHIMAQNATVYKVELSVSDMDRHYHETYKLTVAMALIQTGKLNASERNATVPAE